MVGPRNIDAQLLADALLHAPVAWALFDLDAHGIAGSREYASVFDLTPDDLVALPFGAMMEPEDADHTMEVMAQVARGDTEEFVSVLTSQRPGGGDVLVRVTMRALRRAGEPVALFSTAVPLTDEAQVQSRLIATVSHELRNPLHAMSGLAELLTTSPGLGDDAAELAQMLRRQIDGLATVIDDLLDSSRLGVGAVSLQIRPVMLRSLVDDVVTLAAQGARGRPVDVRGEIADGTPECVAGDSARLRQVLSNLVGNAVKFTAEGQVVLHVAPSDGGVRFDVVDSGTGIATEELLAVFEPFTTGTDAGDRAGAGLGLTIVRQLVDLMGGDIAAYSERGSGTTFTVTLPLVAAEAPPTIEPAPQLVATGQAVLVVEDDSVNQVLALNQLARLGMTAVVVGTGEEAVEVLALTDAPAVVLMDCQLPGIDGIEATRRIREQEAGTGRRAIIIGVTAAATEADRRACARAGMDDFLPKPVSLAALGDALRRWLHELPADSELPDFVDIAALDRLAADLGGRSVVVDLVTTFLDELHGRRAALSDAAASGDLEGARRVAHTLKSSSLLLGAHVLGTACQQIEHASTADVAQQVTGEILRHAADAARWYQTWLGRHAS